MPRRMRALASFVTGRRTKFVILGLWIVLAILFSPLGSKLADETQDDTASFLPESAESTEVVNLLDDRFASQETSQGLIVYQRDGGLTEADKQKIADDAAALEALGEDELPLVRAADGRRSRTGSPPELVSEDELARLHRAHPADRTSRSRRTGARRCARPPARRPTGCRSCSPATSASTPTPKRSSATSTRSCCSRPCSWCLVLLGAIYRSVLVALTPLIVVFLAYTVANGFIYLLAKSGATVSSNSTSILIVLMFGVGTDYCLLLVSRLREELRTTEDKHEAMARALRRSGPAILASGLTVTLAMLVLALADSQNTATLGPVAAIGVASAMVAGLTLLPALLTIFGRRGFWPRSNTVAYDPEHAATQRPGLWRRFGDRVLQKPGQALVVTLIVFVAGALGLLAFKVDYSTTTFFKKEVESRRGIQAARGRLPTGRAGPDDDAGHSECGEVTEERSGRRGMAAEGVDGSGIGRPERSTRTATRQSTDATIAAVDVVLDQDPYTKAALGIVPDDP